MESEDTPAKVSIAEIKEVVDKYNLYHIKIFEEYLRINVEDIFHWKEYLINRNEELIEKQRRK